VWSLLTVQTESDQAGVVLLREELERGCIFERMYGVFLVKANGEGPLERVQVAKGKDYDIAGLFAPNEEGNLGVFIYLRFALLQSALRASIFRFAENRQLEFEYW